MTFPPRPTATIDLDAGTGWGDAIALLGLWGGIDPVAATAYLNRYALTPHHDGGARVSTHDVAGVRVTVVGGVTQ